MDLKYSFVNKKVGTATGIKFQNMQMFGRFVYRGKKKLSKHTSTTFDTYRVLLISLSKEDFENRK